MIGSTNIGKEKRIWIYRCVVILTLMIFGNIHAYADNDAFIKIDGRDEGYDLTNVIHVLEDKEKEWTSADMLDPQVRERFIPYKDSKLSGKISDAAYWAKVTIENGTDDVQSLFLEISKPHLSKITAYRYDHEKLMQEVHTGRAYPFAQREIEHRNFLFEVKILPRMQETIFLRVETESYFQLPIHLYNSKSLLEKEYDTQLFLGIYYGIMLAMFLYNLVLFISLRDKVYLYYVLFILGFSIMQLIWDGLAFQFIWPKYPSWDVKSNPFFLVFTSFFALQFSRNFLQVDGRSKLVDRVIRYALWLIGFICVLILFIPPVLSLKLSVYVVTLTLIMCISSIWIVGFHSRSVYLYSIAWGMLFLGALLNLLAAYRVLPLNFVTLYSPRMGAVNEVVLLSLALANRFNTIKQEKMVEEKQKVLLKKLHEITKTLTSTHDLDILLRYTLKSVSEITKYENGMIILKQDEKYVIKDALGYHERGLRGKVLEAFEQDISFKTLGGEDRAVTLMDVEMSCYGIHNTAKMFTGIPIIYHENLIGVIVLYSMHARNINDSEYQIIYDYAGQVGISIENLRLFDKVKTMATVDGLTGVFNRAHFTNMAEHALNEVLRSNGSLSLMMIDIDYFKQINDTYGHIVGDRVLKELANSLRQVFNSNGVIGRYGGEEFLVLLKDTNIQEAYSVAEKVRKVVEKLRIHIDEKRIIKLTISIGVSSSHKDIDDIWSLVEKADQALYLSKQNGRNLVNIC